MECNKRPLIGRQAGSAVDDRVCSRPQAGSTVDDRMMLTAARRECCRPGDAHGRTPGVLYIG